MATATDDPLGVFPVAPFLEATFPRNGSKWVGILEGEEITTAACWGSLLDEDRVELRKQGLPRRVFQELDNWFEQQLGKWMMEPPERNRGPCKADEVICREATRKELVDYIFACVAGPPTDGTSNRVWSKGTENAWKCQMMCTSGIMGIGKSTVLNQVGPWVQGHVDELNEAAGSPAAAVPMSHTVLDALRGFKVASVSYNGGSDRFPVPSAGDEALCFGQHLLRSNGFPDRWLGKVRSLEHALCIMRAGLELNDTQVLIITVDEMIELHQRCRDVGRDRVLEVTVSDLMRVQDTSLASKKQPTVFIFTSILEEFYRDAQRRTGSGRSVEAIALHHLNLQEAHKLLFEKKRGLRDAAVQSSALRQLILSCMGHPRALFDGIAGNVNVMRTNTCAIAGYREQILRMCKLDALQTEKGGIVEKWFCGTLSREEREMLVVSGVLHRVDGIPFILPLMLHDWAARVAADTTQPEWILAHHLLEAYDADCVVESTHEKKVEEVVMHYEAVRRISCAKRSDGETLGTFYTTPFIGPKWMDRAVTIKVPVSSNGMVRHVRDFTDTKTILKQLRAGFIVASEKRTEQGLEYVSPFFDAEDETKVLVAVVQVKFVQRQVNFAEVKRKLEPGEGFLGGGESDVDDEEGDGGGGEAVDSGKDQQDEQFATKHNAFTRWLIEKGIEWFPVVYTTHHTKTDTLNATTHGDGVYFTEQTLFDFTKPLGILRIHLEKLGRNIQHRCPTLARPPATKRGRESRQPEVDK